MRCDARYQLTVIRYLVEREVGRLMLDVTGQKSETAKVRDSRKLSESPGRRGDRSPINHARVTATTDVTLRTLTDSLLG